MPWLVELVRRALAAAAALGLLGLLGLSSACGRGVTQPRVFAAASIAPAVERVLADAGRHAGLSGVKVVSGASSTLAKQLVAGAEGAVFVSADPRWIDYVRERLPGDLPTGESRDLVGNELVVIASRRARPGFERPATKTPGVLDWLPETVGKIAIGDPEHVPVGRYAKAALAELALWPRLEKRVVAAVDARAALRIVERGECPFGVVYRTDARSSSRVEVVGAIPPAAAPRVRYRTLRLQDSPLAQALDALLRSEAAYRMYRDIGFEVGQSKALPDSVDPAMVPDDRGWWPSGPELGALRLSVQVGAVATLWVLIPGVALGYWLARTRSRWRSVVEAAVLLPLVLPPVIVGYGLMAWFGQQGPIGGWLESWFGIRLAFTWRAAALASAVLGFPLLVRTARGAFSAVDSGLGSAAATLGAGPWRTFITITLPLAGRGVLAGVLLCFARSLGEFGATITFAANVAGETSTLPVAIWTELQRPGGDHSAWRMTMLCIVVAVAATLACELLVRRGVRR